MATGLSVPSETPQRGYIPKSTWRRSHLSLGAALGLSQAGSLPASPPVLAGLVYSVLLVLELL